MGHLQWSAAAVVVCVIVGGLQMCSCTNSSYENINRLMQDLLLNNPEYNKYLRPVNNQSHGLVIYTAATLLAIIEVDDVEQVLTFNAFFNFFWTDQRLVWDPDDYGEVNSLAFDSNHIWKPQFVIFLSQSRQVFQDDDSHVFVSNVGFVTYGPGGVYKSICQVDMRKFPFDSQTCSFSLCPLGYLSNFVSIEVLFEEIVNPKTLANEEWEIKEARMTNQNFNTEPYRVSCATVLLELKRRPTFMLVNIVLPVVLISFINNLSFVIPVDSGEKISFAVTLLLSLSVYMTVVSDLVPRSSNKVPALTIYLFIILLNSLLTVVVTVIIVYVHNYRERHQADRAIDKGINEDKKLKKITLVHPNNKVHHGDSIIPGSNFSFLGLGEKEAQETEANGHSFADVSASGHSRLGVRVREYRSLVSLKFVLDNGNILSFIFFSALWTCSTIWYFVYAMS